jgi:mannose PTS system EIIC component
MGTAIFLELFWLDFFPAGTFIPPQSLLSFFLVLTTASLLGLEGVQEIALILVAALPLGWLGSRLEWFQRTLQDATYNSLINSARSGSPFAPGKLVKRSLIQTMALSFLLFLAAQVLFLFTFRFVFSSWGEPISSVPMQWAHLWVLGSIGPLVSLRHRVPYLFLLVGLGVAAGALWLLTKLQP